MSHKLFFFLALRTFRSVSMTLNVPQLDCARQSIMRRKMLIIVLKKLTEYLKRKNYGKQQNVLATRVLT